MKQTRFSVSRTVSASSNSRGKAVVMRLGSVKYRNLPHARLDDDPPLAPPMLVRPGVQRGAHSELLSRVACRHSLI